MSSLEVAITYITADGGRTHAPMVEAEVNGLRTLLVVDTGSTDHILTTDLVEALGLQTTEGETGTDSSGAPVPSWCLATATVTLARRELRIHDLVVIPPPEPFRTGGIGGILSPQHLAAPEWAVLDMAADRFCLLEADADLADWLARSHEDGGLADRLEPAPSDGTVMTTAAIAPHEPVPTMLDTGARVTEFATSAVPGIEEGERRSVGRGVGGTERFGRAVTDRELILGSQRIPLASLVLVDGHGDALGLVGMDVLRGTVLALNGDQQRPIWWLRP